MTAATEKPFFAPLVLDIQGLRLFLLLAPEGAVFSLSFDERSQVRAKNALLAAGFDEALLPGAVARRVSGALELYLGAQKENTGLAAAPFFSQKATDFQRRVWRAIAAIPYGETRTYGDIAIAAGSPAALRAAGQACGANPVALLVPCHRVVGRHGLGGFGGGLAIKRRLLAMEKAGRKKVP